ncbi:MAG TPA: cytochrome c oxidase assembly protein [Solirubrobacterales bacterium]|jgi:cytochrome c oxidase assembly factor CtaG|nr:cytochrome c oxidase assembly protein [Solirubrobacterales bacterium]
MTPRRATFLLAGWAVVGVALSPTLDAAADRGLPLHMLQHMLLLAVAPPLLVLGEPVRVAFALLPAGSARRLSRALRRRPLATLLNPAVALALFVAIVVGTHLPAFFDLTLESDPLHALEHLGYLAAGLLLWSAALGADPAARPLSIVAVVGMLTAAMVPMIAVGVALDTASGVLYAPYAAGSGAGAALAEQNPAATVMWAGDLPFMVAIVLAGWAALRREERLQRLTELVAQSESTEERRVASPVRSQRGGPA